MKIKRLIRRSGLAAFSLLAVLTMLLGLSISPVNAVPPIPEIFYGIAYVNGVASTSGTVTAQINSIQYGSATITSTMGTYNGNQYNYFLTVSPADGVYSGTINFFVNGQQATETGSFVPGGPSGLYVMQNLHVGTTPTLTVTTGAASSITATTAVLGGNLTSMGSDSPVNVSFEYGTTTGYGSFTTAVAVTTTGAYSASISGLAPGTLYYFHAKAVGTVGGIVTGNQGSFTTLSTSCTVPLVNIGTASSITSASASVCATVSCLCTSGATSLCFDYGPTTSYAYTSSCQTVTSAGSYCTTLSGLSASTTYYYRAKLTCASGTVYSASYGTFTTSGASTGGCSSSCCQWVWGTAYLNNAPAYNTTITAYANGVQAATAQTDYQGGYSIYVPVTNGATITFAVSGNAASESTTGACMGTSSNFSLHASNSVLSVSTGTGTGTSSTTATLNGTLTGLGPNPPALVYFQYGLTTSYSNTTPAQSMTAVGSFSASITGLSPSTTYHFRANATGAATPGADSTFTTTTPQLSVSTGAASSVATTTASISGNLLDKGSDTTVNVSFNYGPTTSMGSNTTPQSIMSTGLFSASLAGLSPGTTYYYQAKAVGLQSGQTVVGPAPLGTFTTGSAPSGCPSNCCQWFYGTAYLNGAPVTSGTVAGLVNGVQAATTTVNTGGGYNFYVPVTNGATVTFTVNGLTAVESTTGQCMGVNNNYNLHTSSGTVTVTTGSGTYATTTTANLNGTLASLGSDGYAMVSFDWGTSTLYGFSTTPFSVVSLGGFGSGITGLTVGQTYHFKAKAVGSPSGTIVYGSDVTYFHNPGGTLSVTTGSGSYASPTTATLSGSITGWNSSDTSAATSFVWSTTNGGPYTNTVTASPSSFTGTGTFTGTLSGLTSGQTYYIKARAVGTSSGEKLGAQLTYVHTPGGTLAVSTGSGIYLDTTSATLNGTLSSLGSYSSAYVSFVYGPTTGYGLETSQVLVSSTGAFSATLTGLTAGQVVYFNAKAIGNAIGATPVYGTGSSYTHTPPSPDCLGSTTGNLSSTVVANSFVLGRFQATCSNINKINLRSQSTGNAMVALYAGDSSYNIGAKIYGDTSTTHISYGVNVFTIPAQTLTVGNYYWLGWWTDANSITGLDTGAATDIWASKDGGSSFSFPTTVTDMTTGTRHKALISASN